MIKVLTNLVSDESPLRSLQMATFSLCPPMTSPQCICTGEGGKEKERELSGVSSQKNTNPVGSGPHPCDLINLNYFLGGPISTYSHKVGLGFQHKNSKRYKYYVYITN